MSRIESAADELRQAIDRAILEDIPREVRDDIRVENGADHDAPRDADMCERQGPVVGMDTEAGAVEEVRPFFDNRELHELIDTIMKLNPQYVSIRSFVQRHDGGTSCDVDATFTVNTIGDTDDTDDDFTCHNAG